MLKRLTLIGLLLAAGVGGVVFLLAWAQAPRRWKEFMLARLKDEDPENRVQAAKWLWSRARDEPDQETVSALAEALDDEEERVANYAGLALARAPSEWSEPVQILIGALASEKPSVRRIVAAAMIGLTRTEPVIAPLITALEDEDLPVRRAVAQSLSVLMPGRREHLPPLMRAMQDGDSSVRKSIGYALGEFGAEAKEAVPLLRDALADGDEGVRVAAAHSLGKIGPEARAAVPALALALKDGSSRIRETAATALGEVGPGAKEAMPALREALRDEDQGVREEAARALKRIDPEAVPKTGIE